MCTAWLAALQEREEREEKERKGEREGGESSPLDMRMNPTCFANAVLTTLNEFRKEDLLLEPGCGPAAA